MRIAIVSPYISTLENIEYYQSQQLNLAVELAKLGVYVDIITADRQSGEAELYHVNEKVTVYRLPVVARWTNIFFNQLIMVGLWKQLGKQKYDFIQSSDDCIFSTLESALYVLLKRSRLIIYQGIYEYSTRKILRIFMRLYDFTAGIVLRRSCFMAICKTQRASKFMQNKGFKRTQVVPVGVNTDLFYPTKREKDKTLELLAVGNLIPLKNYPLIIEVFEFIMKRDQNVRLTIIGSGLEKSRILNLAEEKKLGDHLRLLEHIPNREMRRYYSQADLLLLLSRTEIFGMVILEAMACGCQVMATPTPGVVDIISDEVNGFILSNLHPAAIAERIMELFSNPDHIDCIRSNAFKIVKEQYAWAVIAKQYNDLYLRVENK